MSFSGSEGTLSFLITASSMTELATGPNHTAEYGAAITAVH